MMRLLNDKAGRMYQRVGLEGESLKQEPQDPEPSWSRPAAGLAQEEPLPSHWSPDAPFSPQAAGQYGTRSKTLRMLNTAKSAVKVNGGFPAFACSPSYPRPPRVALSCLLQI